MSDSCEITEARGRLAVKVVAMPADTNANGDIFGGWLVSHMDLGGSIEARRRSQSRTVTVAIDKLKFIKPVSVGDAVSCYVELIAVGRTSMQFQIQVWAQSASSGLHRQVAEGAFTFVAIDDQGKPWPVDRQS